MDLVCCCSKQDNDFISLWSFWLFAFVLLVNVFLTINFCLNVGTLLKFQCEISSNYIEEYLLEFLIDDIMFHSGTK